MASAEIETPADQTPATKARFAAGDRPPQAQQSADHGDR